MNISYKAYCLGRMLLDKSYNYMTDNKHENGNEKKTQRIYNVNRGITGALYDLTYEQTYIIDKIYLGNGYNARNYYKLVDDNIGLIVNCTKEIPDYFHDHFDYYRVDVRDLNGEDIYPYLDDTVVKIHDYIDNNPLKGIFVHCFMGSSRSATIVIAYLMKYYLYSLNDAIKFVKDKRPLINLNTDFFSQLKSYQQFLRTLPDANLEHV